MGTKVAPVDPNTTDAAAELTPKALPEEGTSVDPDSDSDEAGTVSDLLFVFSCGFWYL